MKKLGQTIVNEMRVLSAQMIHHANSGHTGVALGAAPIFYSLFAHHLMLDDTNPLHPQRDRFVLSAGHASAILYATLHLFGLGLSKEDLMQFRRVGSKTPGHPEWMETPFVEATTGPLGQGIAMGVGMAIAEEHRRATSQTPPLHTYVFHGDGCLMEGVALEAISLAGNLKLENLVLLYDYNQITIDGSLDLSNREQVAKKFISQGWRVICVKDGNSVSQISKAISKAKKPCGKPTIVIVPTIIGFGSSKAGTAGIHGTPLKENELEQLKQTLNVNMPDFTYSDDVKQFINQIKLSRKQKEMLALQGTETVHEWQEADVKEMIKSACNNLSNTISGRDAGASMLNALANAFPSIIGGTADLVPSVRAYIQNGGDFSAENRSGRNIRYGVREHAMAAVANGIALFGQNKTFVSTFFSFTNYMAAGMRMSALMKLPVVYIFTHDSIFAGEDGPTHQPVEQLGSLRLLPNMHVVRPCDKNEIAFAYQFAFSQNLPTSIVLAKQTLPLLETSITKSEKGGYLVKENKAADATIMASGSEVNLALQVATMLEKEQIFVNVASMPCTSLFDMQSSKYQQSILGSKPRFAIEASNDNIWHKYIAGNGLFFGVSEFGKSGKGEDVYALFYDTKKIASQIKKFLKNNV